MGTKATGRALGGRGYGIVTEPGPRFKTLTSNRMDLEAANEGRQAGTGTYVDSGLGGPWRGVLAVEFAPLSDGFGDACVEEVEVERVGVGEVLSGDEAVGGIEGRRVDVDA